MAIQSNAGFQQDCHSPMRDLNNSVSNMYQPHAQDLPSGQYSPCFETPYDKYQRSSGQTSESNVDNLIDTEPWTNGSIAPISACTELHHGLSDVEVPSIGPATVQCDPWCSAAMHRRVHSSNMSSWDYALAKCGAKPFLGKGVIGCLPRAALPYHFPPTLFTRNSYGCTPLVSSAKATATGRLVGSMLADEGSVMAMLQDPAEDNIFPEITSNFGNTKELSDVVYPPQFYDTISLDPCLTIPKHDDFPFRPEGSGFAPRSDKEPNLAPGGEMKPEQRPYGYLLPISEIPAKNDHLQGIPLSVASPNCVAGLGQTPWNGNRVTSYPHLPLPEDDGTTLGLHVPRTAINGEGEQYRVADMSLEAEKGPSESCVPPGYLSACRSNRRRKRRRFTNDEKAIINYKRKVGVCEDCRQAKRKCTHVTIGIEKDATKGGIIRIEPQGTSVFDGSRLSDIDMERRNSDYQ